ncbi:MULTISPECIES: DUF2603 domain-containing protein [Nitratiruptor]|uniref:UPF0763 protein SAMN05660197_0821 n=1 Tax=Nitratiruptor tergarcus DSM 16512 TaxID=1069081 RepID=A0A1W1WRW6_9BACT|nr:MULTISPECIES: DUF2603 domain-containing protein [Nitratiruptor]BCD61536.1 hypothetical protein NitYY0813_C0390 [Nitratiruptor sp. YY08-13]BCD65470.1 hypothetical protein NitYY0826_C0391 [Nitratiruptor sp. YY08-26]SMC09027.1 Protein of unknown function [Nitratiruptor tergarcus DSM 16512]
MDPVKITGENLLSQINKMAGQLGIENPANVTVVKLEDTEDPNKKTLELIQGSWENNAPWFVIGKENKVFVLSSLEAMLHLIKSLNEAKYENFNLKLEKAILENLPIDFNDVWVVAMNEIQKRLAESKNKNLLDIDIKKLVQDIKKNHPNLFMRLKDFQFPPMQG